MNSLDDITLESCPCPLGCNASDRLVFTGRDRLHKLPGEFTVVQCRGCGLMRTNPRPDAQSIGHYYPDEYAPYIGTIIQPEQSHSLASKAKKLFSVLIDFKTESIPSIPTGKMLEVGCASGRLLQKMTQQGWEVEGIEFSDVAAERAKAAGFIVKSDALENISNTNAQYDLVTGWMVVEHLHQPVQALEKLANWAKPNGWLAISVPNAGSVEFRIFKDYWHALQLPTHLYHFTPDTLTALLNKAGWEVKKIQHQRVITSQFESVGYWLGDAFPNNPVSRFLIGLGERSVFWNILFYPLAWGLSLFGQTGRMTVWAQKK